MKLGIESQQCDSAVARECHHVLAHECLEHVLVMMTGLVCV